MSKKTSFYESLKKLRNALDNLFKDTPSFTYLFYFVIVILTAYVFSYSQSVMAGIIIILVVVTSIIVYASTNNFGEASLALVAGLLTVFTVEWTIGNSIVFIIAWATFCALALSIYSVRLASKNEEIYLHAAQFLSENNADVPNLKSELQDIGKESGTLLGPIEKAEAIRILAFRKVPVGLMKELLTSIDQISAITKVDYIKVSNFFSELYRLLEVTPKTEFRPTLDGIYYNIKEAPVPPIQYIEAFNNGRRLVLSNQIDLVRLLEGIRIGLSEGESPDSISDYLLENYAQPSG